MNRTVIRTAVAADLPALQALIGRRVELPARPGERLWLAESDEGGLVASVRLRPPIGQRRPRWWYHVGCAVHAAAELGVYHRQPTLLLGNDLTGAAELSDLALAADPARADDGTTLRGLLQAAVDAAEADPATYGRRLIAELPGPRDGRGRSPFWVGLGRHFYGGDPLEAEARHGRGWRSHVAALLPRQTLYSSFLPEDAQAAIGEVAIGARPLALALADCGFGYHGHVCIDDAGRVLERELGAATR